MSILDPAARRWHIRKTAGSFDRTVPAARTVERLMARRKAYGITRVSDITGLDDLGIPAHSAFRPRFVSSASVHSGKGLTAAESLASALAEAIEVDCCERYRPTDAVRGSLAALRRHYPMADLPPHAVPGGRGVPEHVDLDWVFVDDLLALDQAPGRVLIPLEFVQQGHANPDARVLFQTMMSAGIASGNILAEALSHAISELIERDSVAIFLFRAKYLRDELRGRYSTIETSGLPLSAQRLVERVRAADRRLALVDATTDVGVPTVICRITTADGAVCGGFWAALSAESAVLRAITEAAQTSTANIQGAREDLTPLTRDPRLHERAFGLESSRARELFADPSTRSVTFASLPSRYHEFIDQDCDVLLEALRSAGIRHVDVADVSDEACVDFRVVRVIVPELERTRLDCIGPRRLWCALER